MKTISSVILMGALLIVNHACAQSGKSLAEKELSRMNASDYFKDEASLRFAEAAASGKIEELETLLKSGVAVDTEGDQGMRPVFWAFLKRNLEGYAFLLENGADPNHSVSANGGSISIMQLAAIEENSTYLRLALAHGGNPNAPDDDGDRTIIFDAIMHSRIANVILLIENKADLNLKDRSGSTPLLVAASINRYQIVYTLLANGADPRIKDNLNYNLIDMIERYGSKGIHKGSNEYEWLLKVADQLHLNIDENK